MSYIHLREVSDCPSGLENPISERPGSVLTSGRFYHTYCGFCRLRKPGFETSFAEPCTLARHERAFVDFHSEVPGGRVRDYRAVIVACPEALPYKFVEVELFRPAD